MVASAQHFLFCLSSHLSFYLFLSYFLFLVPSHTKSKAHVNQPPSEPPNGPNGPNGSNGPSRKSALECLRPSDLHMQWSGSCIGALVHWYIGGWVARCPCCSVWAASERQCVRRCQRWGSGDLELGRPKTDWARQGPERATGPLPLFANCPLSAPHFSFPLSPKQPSSSLHGPQLATLSCSASSRSTLSARFAVLFLFLLVVLCLCFLPSLPLGCLLSFTRCFVSISLARADITITINDLILSFSLHSLFISLFISLFTFPPSSPKRRTHTTYSFKHSILLSRRFHPLHLSASKRTIFPPFLLLFHTHTLWHIVCSSAHPGWSGLWSLVSSCSCITTTLLLQLACQIQVRRRSRRGCLHWAWPLCAAICPLG